jgi:hypothetical protein
MGQLFTNFGYSTLASGIASGDTSLSVASGAGARFPSPVTAAGDFFDLVIEEASPADAINPAREIVRCTARSGDALTTIARGQEGTAARAWLAGDKVELRLVAGTVGGMSRNSVGGAILLASKLGAL